MDPIAILAMVNAALTILEKLSPEIGKQVTAGNISVDEQTAARARLDALRSDAAFQGPEWQV